MILKSNRINKNLSILEVCEQLRISRSSLVRYEKLERFPDIKMLKKFKRFYNISDEIMAEMFIEYFYKNL